MKRNGPRDLTGVLLVDKPAGITSHDVVDCIRRAVGMRRIGHTGTLDPAATGLLVLCLGKATRLSEHLTGLDKGYEGALRFGIETDSYDQQGSVVGETPVPELSVADIQKACDAFTGDIMQVPPMVSAVKVGGERLYKKARQGEVVEREPRPVTVREFHVKEYTPPDALIRVRCTRGTYVRSLCHEVGQAIGCGAILASLRRTFVGKHTVGEATTLDGLQEREDVEGHLLSIDDVVELPQILVPDSTCPAIAAGQTLRPREWMGECPVEEGWVQLKLESGKLLALGQVNVGPAGIWIHPKRVFVG